MKVRVRVRVLALVLAFSLFDLYVGSEMSVADNFGDTAGCSYLTGAPDGAGGANCVSMDITSGHVARFFGLGNDWPGMDSASTYAIGEIDTKTVMVASVSNFTLTPDVRVMDSSYFGITLFGWVDCPPIAIRGTRFVEDIPNPRNVRTCQPQDVRYNAIFQAGENLASITALACHEIGHTTGLLHDTNTTSCMRQGSLTHEDNTMSTEDINHINNEY